MPEEDKEDIKIYTISLRTNAPRSRKTSACIKKLKNEIARHAKSDNVWVDPLLNQYLWRRGIKKHIPKIKVKATKFEDGLVEVTLLGEETKEEEKQKNA